MQQSVLNGVVDDVTSIISDIDGTLVHYAAVMRGLGYEPLSGEEQSLEEEAYLQKEEEEQQQQQLQEEKGMNHTPLCTNIDSSEDVVRRLLRWRYTPQARRTRFATLPMQLWRHRPSGRVLRMYELYNVTLQGALISEDTVLLLELLQNLPQVVVTDGCVLRPADSVMVTLITGARVTTYRGRRTSGALPQATYEACEGGGKLWCRRRPQTAVNAPPVDAAAADRGDAVLPMLYPHDAEVPLDAVWLQRFSAVTGASASAEEAPKRGPLWEVCELVRGDGFTVDDRATTTSFFIDIANSPAVVSGGRFANATEAEHYLIRRFETTWGPPYGVVMHVNLGKGHVHAAGCGKKEVMEYILHECEAAAVPRCVKAHAVALFDDCNDLPFAMECGVGILPSVAHEKVLWYGGWESTTKGEAPAATAGTAEARRRAWFRPPYDGPLGAEWALQQILLFLMTKNKSAKEDR
ncbi:hypothetical protein DQ04_00801040 [Trypanosoma grayi]|uniref:hypothetical protein n=1 Tax=Trypanosoma grayi TaxID=71804 RepID=UPI0004F4A470|nr:hypothetical protein DQ04_00801040 [Trypanosoma grayi]KEG13763.1 hypothetical protein DQ04_00801040 [Trypanosoma grayi]